MGEPRWYAKPHGRRGWTWGIDGMYVLLFVVLALCLVVALVMTGAAFV